MAAAADRRLPTMPEEPEEPSILLPTSLLSGLMCPLCKELLSDPVATVDGDSFCRHCVEDYAAQSAAPGSSKPMSPTAGNALSSTVVLPNMALAKVLASLRQDVLPAWAAAESDRTALRRKFREMAGDDIQSLAGQVKALQQELLGSQQEVQRVTAELNSRPKAVALEELQSQFRASASDVRRLQGEVDQQKKQLAVMSQKHAAEKQVLEAALGDQAGLQKELSRLREQVRRQESLLSAAVLSDELDKAKILLSEKSKRIKDLEAMSFKQGEQVISLQQKVKSYVDRRADEEGELERARKDAAANSLALSETKQQLRRFEGSSAENKLQEAIRDEKHRLNLELEQEKARIREQLHDILDARARHLENLLRGLPLVLADFLEDIDQPDPVLADASARPEDVPRLILDAVRKLHSSQMRHKYDLADAHTKVVKLCKQNVTSLGATVDIEAELLYVSERARKAEEELAALKRGAD